MDLHNSRNSFEASSENMRFAASLAGLGMLLKNSNYKGDLNFDDVRRWGNNARSYDPYGFRDEYIELIDKVRNLN